MSLRPLIVLEDAEVKLLRDTCPEADELEEDEIIRGDDDEEGGSREDAVSAVPVAGNKDDKIELLVVPSPPVAEPDVEERLKDGVTEIECLLAAGEVPVGMGVGAGV